VVVLIPPPPSKSSVVVPIVGVVVGAVGKDLVLKITAILKKKREEAISMSPI